MSAASLFAALRTNDTNYLRPLLQEDPALAQARNEEGLSAVLLAQYSRRHDALTALLAARPGLDIFEAAAVGNAERVRALLATDPSLAGAYAPDGFFPLGLAVFFGHPEAARVLLDAGADVNAVARNRMGVRAIHAAVADKSETVAAELVELLVARGADVNARQHGGFTPLHGAAQNGRAPVVDLLLAHGADPGITTEDGRTAADLAAAQGHTGIAERLRVPA